MFETPYPVMVTAITFGMEGLQFESQREPSLGLIIKTVILCHVTGLQKMKIVPSTAEKSNGSVKGLLYVNK
jgi:hypothetical protein